jgi:hypothetical protein
VSAAEAHRRLERVLARAMRSRDPAAALQRAARGRHLPRSIRRALERADANGARMAALLVARLRFERLLRGSPDADAHFRRDPAAFTARFARYHRLVRPTGFSAAAEGALFAAFSERTRE